MDTNEAAVKTLTKEFEARPVRDQIKIAWDLKAHRKLEVLTSMGMLSNDENITIKATILCPTCVAKSHCPHVAKHTKTYDDMIVKVIDQAVAKKGL